MNQGDTTNLDADRTQSATSTPLLLSWALMGSLRRCGRTTGQPGNSSTTSGKSSFTRLRSWA